jgi:hypothetical protein
MRRQRSSSGASSIQRACWVLAAGTALTLGTASTRIADFLSKRSHSLRSSIYEDFIVSVEDFDFSNLSPEDIIEGARRGSLRDRAVAAREAQVEVQRAELDRQDAELEKAACEFLMFELDVPREDVDAVKFDREHMGGNRLKRQAIFRVDGIEFRVRYGYGDSDEIVIEASRTPGVQNYTKVETLADIGKLIIN